MVLLPQGTQVNGGLIDMDGELYMVGPALYKLQPAETAQPSVLGPQFDKAFSSYDPQHVAAEHWPPGFALDSAVACDFSEEIELENTDD